jgi:hypothetical protein
LPRYQNYIEYEAYYDLHIGSRDRKEIEKTIESKGGHVIRVTYLGRGPILDKDAKNMLIDSSLMGAAAFVSGLASVFGLSGKVVEGLIVGGITAVSAFIMEIVIERKIRQH